MTAPFRFADSTCDLSNADVSYFLGKYVSIAYLNKNDPREDSLPRQVWLFSKDFGELLL